ncbi:RNA polymerase sigma-70 factor [Fulvivirgaceae bacterium BMA10]|uniref:RNA polymerase sigma-70 factor n=1 Tax=Splendidivirga corallicola TaxID=3051826 RepID=A0ABT8KRA9_9BACT|nr:RNA polymerase sigma-70 factor [Fulvivirgaceae bacterium BMA10]
MKAEILNIEDLLNKIRLCDDQKSFEILFNHYFDKLYRVAFSIIKKHEIAEEVVEDVFFKFWQMKDRYPFIKSLDSYLFVATKNGAYDYLKKNNKYTLDLHEQHADVLCHFISPERSYLVEELKEQIEQAVNNLPPKCRKVFELIRQDGLTHKLAAETLGVSVKTIENQMTIAIKKIAKELESYLYQTEEVPYTKLATVLLFCFLGII